MQILAIVVSLAITAVAVVLAVRTIRSMLSVIRLGRPAVGRSDRRGARWKGLVTETLGHTRMLQWQRVGVLHWFVMIGFIGLFLTLVATAYGQLFVADLRAADHRALDRVRVVGRHLLLAHPDRRSSG